MNRLCVAYFVNQYPKVSHSFIRREILALERKGFEVVRIALRGWDAELVDDEDKSELSRTHYVLKRGLMGLLIATSRTLITQPGSFLTTLLLAVRMSFKADRPWPYHLICLAEACLILPWLREHRVNHLHAHFGTNSAEVAMLAASLGEASFSFTVHGPEEFDKPEFIKIKEKAKRASFVIAISSFCRSQLYRWIDYSDWQKVEVVHCGLEKSFYEYPYTPIPEVPRIVCVGRLCEQKGQLLLIKAASQLAQRGIDFELVLAGDGEMRSELEALIDQSMLRNKVRITGWISSSQVITEILSARGLILPSFAEGLPVVIMEAMALRRPVVTTYIAGIPELVIHGENGWLFPAGDLESLTDALEELLKAPVSQLQAMGIAGYERVTKRHSIDNEVGKLVELFKSRTNIAIQK